MSTLADIAAGQAVLDEIAMNRKGAAALERLSKRAGTAPETTDAEFSTPAESHAIEPQPGDSAGIQTHTEDGKPRAQSAVLIDIGRTHVLFHDDGGDAYAKAKAGARTAVMAIGGTEYREVLGREYFALTGKGANRNAVGDAVSTLAAIAKYDGGMESVFLRVASTPSGIEIDIGDATGDAVIVTGSGWRIAAPTVNFRRSGKPMPLPRPGVADFSLIWNHVNVAIEDRPLLAAWLLAALRPSGPYPIALLIGEQGTGKSAASRALKSLTDPSAVMLRPPPREDRDLLVAAVSSWTVALDNLSGINPQLSDCLCRLSTGGGFAGRRLYTDSDETLIEIQRPVIANGIDDIASRPDLADRCLHLLLPPLESRKTEGAMKKRFQADASAIFAALLDGLVLAVRDHATVLLGTLPRMADFATWAAAGLPALGFTAEEFMSAYTRNRDHMTEMAIEASPVAFALVQFMATRDTWTGASADLLGRLADANPGAAAGQAWPKSAKGLMGALRRLAPALRSAGIAVSTRKTETRNVVEVCKARKYVPEAPDVPAAPFKAGTSGAYVPADVPDAPAETRVPGTTGASGASKPTLHGRHCSPDEYRQAANKSWEDQF